MSKSNSKFKLSVIIPTYNRSRLLDYTLLSLQQQDIEKSIFEVIVADDGSADDTRDVVEKHEKLLNIKYVYQVDLGYRPASARNMGIRVADGDICLFIDSGVLLNSDCIRQHINFYKSRSSKVAAVGYVYGFERFIFCENKLIELVDPSNVADSVSRISKNELFFDIREEQYVRYGDQIQDLPASWYYFWTCHVSAPISEISSAGLFDEKYDGRWGVEDSDLAFRLMQQGIKIHLLRSAEAIHYPHEKDKEERKKQGYENCRYFNRKFNTMETQIFLDSYLADTNFTDINKISIEMVSGTNA